MTDLLTHLLDRLKEASSADEVVSALQVALATDPQFSEVEVWPVESLKGPSLPRDAPPLVRRALGQNTSASDGGRTAVILRAGSAIQAVVVAATASEEATRWLHVLVRIAGLATQRHIDSENRQAQATEIAALHQVMEGVAAASSAEEVAASTLSVIVDSFAWDGGVVVQPRTGEDAENAGEHLYLATYHTDDLTEGALALIAGGEQGLRGEMVGERLPGGLTHALVWPVHQPTHTRLVLFTRGPARFPQGLGSVLAPIAQVASVVRAGLERVAQADRQRRAEEAERANIAKSEFLSRMSHELRTPLNAVLGFTQLLEMDDLDPDAMESLDQIRRAGAHLLDLVNEVLDISRIESGRMTLSVEPLELADVVAESMALVQSMADERRIGLSVDQTSLDGLWVHADLQRTKQILLNLLSNGVKYNRPDGSVRVSARPIEHAVQVLVSDTGSGIPPEKMDRLFTPFERLGAEGSSVEGTGLGLALSRRLAEVMEGELEATSTVGRGTTFLLSLPAAAVPESEEVAAEADAGEEPAGVTGTVLYIEDNRPNLKLVQRVLGRRPGVTLRYAETGADGLEQARAELPDLVLLDLDLPDIHGSQVLDLLQADPLTASIPVAVVSADATKQQVRRMLDTGARAYLTKPFNLNELLSLIDELVSPTASSA